MIATQSYEANMRLMRVAVERPDDVLEFSASQVRF